MMEKVNIAAHGAVAVLRLNNGVTNALSPQLVEHLTTALGRIRAKFKGMVLAGGSKFFSIGLDLPELLLLDRGGMAEFWQKFNQCVLDIYTLPLPTACAINGHAIAGGNILALSCDFRYAASGRNLIGLNEIRIGVPVPYLADLLLRQVAGDRAATEMTYSGEFLEPDEAQLSGLLDAVYPETELEDRVLDKISEIAALPSYGFELIKENRVAAIRQKYNQLGKAKSEAFLDCWFSSPVQELLKQAAEKF